MARSSQLLREVRACTLCAAHLPLGPKPILQWHPQAKILIAGQAPGRKAHERGVPFDDVSGDRLRDWLGLDRETFYNATKIALLPMGFCYPGTGTSGDLPPRPECAVQWRERLLAPLQQLQMTLVLGQYAVAWHWPDAKGKLADIVADWRTHWPNRAALPHPSPRNRRWLQQHPEFERDFLPRLKQRVAEVLQNA